MARHNPGPDRLRDTPATDLEIYRIKRARATGKVKNPTWYKAPKMPEPFKPDFTQRFPAHCRPNIIHAPVLEIPQGEFKSTAEYVAEFERVNKLVTAESLREREEYRAMVEREEKANAERQRQRDREYRSVQKRAKVRRKPANAEMAA